MSARLCRVKAFLERIDTANIHPLCKDLPANPCREMAARRTCFAVKRQSQAQNALSLRASAREHPFAMPGRVRARAQSTFFACLCVQSSRPQEQDRPRTTLRTK
jgi:hypothetical protein